jgi:hypothetical protein
MNIVGLEKASKEQIRLELQNGARFVRFEYCASFIVLSFKQRTGVYLVRKGESAVRKSWPFSLLSFLLGWWGIPWGPIYTFGVLATNLRGGIDVTDGVRELLARPSA